ncbi:ferrous iron transport protein B [uncultured Proteiniphilum sp.]|uniref:ferrous iron transport protein B n=1 Tax=uncultured Proteiniphilum sp. TaxID=497637 RepID=UPI0026059195|nr:ferrous iron transport protein B [uncultured Proteiniphilum sp.]
MRLSELQTGQKAYITKVNGSGAFRKRLLEMGFVRGEEVKSILNAPLKDPIKYAIMEYEVSLRRSEAVMIEISMLAGDAQKYREEPISAEQYPSDTDEDNNDGTEHRISHHRNDGLHSEKRIKVALLGNPNSGKTTIFNLASGAHEHVGNYGGVTVDSKEGTLRHNGYKFTLVDLPGTYSLSAYTPEELFVRKHILEEKPDVIVNVVSASAAERNLYLTTELIDLQVPMVIAMNMYDELEESGRTFDHETFSSLINIPIVPTVGKRGEGIPRLLEKVIEVYKEEEHDYVQIPYGRVLEKSIGIMEREFNSIGSAAYAGWNMPLRYICIKLLEGDSDIEKRVRALAQQEQIFSRRDKERVYIEKLLREDPESAFTNARYGFIAGGLKETLTEKTLFSDKTKLIDTLVTHKYIGFPLFFLFLWVMFEATFRLGNYPMGWIEWLVEQLGNLVRNNMSEGPLKALIVDGIIGGVGGVIVFLPNIVILYLFIAFMEDSGYMARAAFIMDKLMHRIGLHGKSFIPLIMGFGCNVPAIMATRTIESRSSRMITMFIVPFMSCSARLPVYILFVSAFVPQYASLVLLGLYAFGILIAAVTARLLRKTAFKEEETPFVMELPPYRMPTRKSIVTHMWDRSSQYLRKMGGPILVASIVIWFLGYFPQNEERDAAFDQEIALIDTQQASNEISSEEREDLVAEIEHIRNTSHQENSYIGNIGKFIEPVMRPLGFDWKISVSLLSGMAAKEIVISTMGVLYTGDSENQQSLQHRLRAESYSNGSPVFTPLVVAGFLLFVLIYFPCVASIVAIKEESHSWQWALFSVLYSTGLAWFIAFLVYQVGNLLI